MSEHRPIPLNDALFSQEVLHRQGIAVVDFWAPWCGPCLQMAPALEAFAESNGGKIRVFKVDVDDNPKTAERYQIRSIPTVIIFRNGEPVYVSRGAMTQAKLQEQVDRLTS
ncbi:MAG: thioredoxin [Thermodesulfobacteriota bacterium]